MRCNDAMWWLYYKKKSTRLSYYTNEELQSCLWQLRRRRVSVHSTIDTLFYVTIIKTQVTVMFTWPCELVLSTYLAPFPSRIRTQTRRTDTRRIYTAAVNRHRQSVSTMLKTKTFCLPCFPCLRRLFHRRDRIATSIDRLSHTNVTRPLSARAGVDCCLPPEPKASERCRLPNAGRRSIGRIWYGKVGHACTGPH